ncbi:hypothetical protein Tco_0570228 [Tanacetum coccineum]
MLVANTRKAIKASKRDLISQHQSGGSSEGAGITPEVLDESQAKSTHTNKGAGITPEVPDVSKAASMIQESDEDWGSEEDEDDVNMEMKDAEPADEDIGDEEMIDVKKVDVEHEEINQEVVIAQVHDDVQEATTNTPATQREKFDVPPSSSSRFVSSNYGSIFLNLDNLSSAETKIISIYEVPPAVNEYLGSSLGDTLQKELQKHNEELRQEYSQKSTSEIRNIKMEHAQKQQKSKYTLNHLIRLRLLRVADLLKHKKRPHDDDDRDQDPPTGPNQGLKKRKASKDVDPSKKPKLTSSSKDTTPSQPKLTGKSAQAEETVFEAEDIDMLLNQGDDLRNTDEQPNVEVAPKQDWFKNPARPPTPDLK